MKNINYYANIAAHNADTNRPTNESTVSSVGDGTGVLFVGRNILVSKAGAAEGDIVVFDKTTSLIKYLKEGTYHAASLPASIVTIGVVHERENDRVLIESKTAPSYPWAQGYTVKIDASALAIGTGGTFALTVNATTSPDIVYGAGDTLASIAALVSTAINSGADNTVLKHWTVTAGATYIRLEHSRYTPVITNVTGVGVAVVALTPVDYQTVLTGVLTPYGSITRKDGSVTSFAGSNFERFYQYYYTSGDDTATDQQVGAGNPIRYSRYNATDNPALVAFYGAGEVGYAKYIDAKTARAPYTKNAIIDRNGKSNTDKLAGIMWVDADGASKPAFPAVYYAKNTTVGTVAGYTTGLEAGVWWLASAYELHRRKRSRRLDLQDAVNKSLTAIGGTVDSPNSSEWASTEYSSNLAWIYSGGNGLLSNLYKNTSYGARSVTAL